MNESKISVIVPVYNVPEDLLRQCLESLKHQKSMDVEYIIVDDGSNSETAKFCDTYSNDKRFKIFHKENGGLSDARNYGFKQVNSEWFMFLDGDDFLEENSVDKLIEISGKENECEIIAFGCIRRLPKKSFLFDYDKQFENNKIYTSEEMLRNVLNFKCQMGDVTSKLFQTDFIRKNEILHSAEVKQGIEGLLYCFDTFKYGAKLKFIDQYFYNYVYNKNSITNHDTDSNQKYVILGFQTIKNSIFKYNMSQEIIDMFYNRILYIIVGAAISVYFSPYNKENYKLKKKRFLEYLNQSLISETLKTADLSKLDIQRKIIIFLVKKKIFFPFVFLGKLRKIQKEI